MDLFTLSSLNEKAVDEILATDKTIGNIIVVNSVTLERIRQPSLDDELRKAVELQSNDFVHNMLSREIFQDLNKIDSYCDHNVHFYDFLQKRRIAAKILLEKAAIRPSSANSNVEPVNVGSQLHYNNLLDILTDVPSLFKLIEIGCSSGFKSSDNSLNQIFSIASKVLELKNLKPLSLLGEMSEEGSYFLEISQIVFLNVFSSAFVDDNIRCECLAAAVRLAAARASHENYVRIMTALLNAPNLQKKTNHSVVMQILYSLDEISPTCILDENSLHPYRCSPGVVISHKGWRAHTFQKDLKLIAIGSTQTPKSGVVEWVTTLIKGTIVLGVATSKTKINENNTLGSDNSSWGINSSGVVYHNGAILPSKGPSFTTGNKVYLKFDVNEKTLSIGLGDDSYIKVAEGITSKVIPAFGFEGDGICLEWKYHKFSYPAKVVVAPIVNVKDEKYATYEKMRHLGLPDDAVRQKMQINGFSDSEIEAFLLVVSKPGPSTTSSATPTTTPSSTTTVLTTLSTTTALTTTPSITTAPVLISAPSTSTAPVLSTTPSTTTVSTPLPSSTTTSISLPVLDPSTTVPVTAISSTSPVTLSTSVSKTITPVVEPKYLSMGYDESKLSIITKYEDLAKSILSSDKYGGIYTSEDVALCLHRTNGNVKEATEMLENKGDCLQFALRTLDASSSLFDSSLDNFYDVTVFNEKCDKKYSFEECASVVLTRISSISQFFLSGDVQNTIEKATVKLNKKGKSTSGQFQEIPSTFDPSSKSSLLSLSEDCTIVTSSTSDYLYACADVGFSEGQAYWEFTSTADNLNDECSCFGAANKPITDPNYQSSPQLYMVRAYNAYKYQRGHHLTDNFPVKIHMGDIVRVSLDLDEGTLSYAVNDIDHGVIFTGVEGEVFPAVCTYRNNISIKILAVYGPVNQQRDENHHLISVMPSFDVISSLVNSLKCHYAKSSDLENSFNIDLLSSIRLLRNNFSTLDLSINPLSCLSSSTGGISRPERMIDDGESKEDVYERINKSKEDLRMNHITSNAFTVTSLQKTISETIEILLSLIKNPDTNSLIRKEAIFSILSIPFVSYQALIFANLIDLHKSINSSERILKNMLIRRFNSPHGAFSLFSLTRMLLSFDDNTHPATNIMFSLLNHSFREDVEKDQSNVLSYLAKFMFGALLSSRKIENDSVKTTDEHHSFLLNKLVSSFTIDLFTKMKASISPSGDVIKGDVNFFISYVIALISLLDNPILMPLSAVNAVFGPNVRFCLKDFLFYVDQMEIDSKDLIIIGRVCATLQGYLNSRYISGFETQLAAPTLIKNTSEVSKKTLINEWLKSHLFVGGINNNDNVSPFLSNFINGDSHEQKLSKLMEIYNRASELEEKNKRQIYNKYPNAEILVKVFRGVLMHSWGLVQEATEIVDLIGKGESPIPSDELISLWATGKEVRNWIKMDQVDSTIIDEAIDRAKFLLQLSPTWGELPPVLHRQLSRQAAVREQRYYKTIGMKKGNDLDSDAIKNPILRRQLSLPEDETSEASITAPVEGLASLDVNRTRFYLTLWQESINFDKLESNSGGFRNKVRNILCGNIMLFIKNKELTPDMMLKAMNEKEKEARLRVDAYNDYEFMFSNLKNINFMCDIARTLSRGQGEIRSNNLTGLEACGVDNTGLIRKAAKGLSSSICKVLEMPVVAQSADYEIHIQTRMHLVSHFITFLKSDDLDSVISCRLFPTLVRLVKSSNTKSVIHQYYIENLWRLFRLVALLCFKATGVTSQRDLIALIVDPLFADLKHLTKSNFKFSNDLIIRAVHVLTFLSTKSVFETSSMLSYLSSANWINLLFSIATLHVDIFYQPQLLAIRLLTKILQVVDPMEIEDFETKLQNLFRISSEAVPLLANLNAEPESISSFKWSPINFAAGYEGSSVWEQYDGNLATTNINVGNKIYTFGGVGKGNTLKDFVVNVVSIVDNVKEVVTISPVGDIPPALRNFTVAHYDGVLYLYGGTSNLVGVHTQANVYVFALDISSLVWKKVVPSDEISPPARSSHSCVVVGKSMFIFGGRSSRGNEIYNDTWIFNFTSKLWNKVNIDTINIPVGRFGASLAYNNGNLFLHGGRVPQYSNVFESAANMELLDGNLTVKSTSAGNCCTFVDRGFSSGIASWEFKILQDEANNEMVAFGAALKPITNISYQNSPELWMYRAYNGLLYSKGVKIDKVIGKAHPNDLILVTVNLDVGTLSYAINGVDQGVAFDNLLGCTVYPAIAFYGNNRSATITKIEYPSMITENDNGNLFGDTWKIDLMNCDDGNGDKFKWEKVADGPLRCFSNSFIHDDKMFIVGGWANGSGQNDVNYFDTITNEWKLVQLENNLKLASSSVESKSANEKNKSNSIDSKKSKEENESQTDKVALPSSRWGALGALIKTDKSINFIWSGGMNLIKSESGDVSTHTVCNDAWMFSLPFSSFPSSTLCEKGYRSSALSYEITSCLRTLGSTKLWKPLLGKQIVSNLKEIPSFVNLIKQETSAKDDTDALYNKSLSILSSLNVLLPSFFIQPFSVVDVVHAEGGLRRQGIVLSYQPHSSCALVLIDGDGGGDTSSASGTVIPVVCLHPTGEHFVSDFIASLFEGAEDLSTSEFSFDKLPVSFVYELINCATLLKTYIDNSSSTINGMKHFLGIGICKQLITLVTKLMNNRKDILTGIIKSDCDINDIITVAVQPLACAQIFLQYKFNLLRDMILCNFDLQAELHSNIFLDDEAKRSIRGISGSELVFDIVPPPTSLVSHESSWLDMCEGDATLSTPSQNATDGYCGSTFDELLLFCCFDILMFEALHIERKKQLSIINNIQNSLWILECRDFSNALLSNWPINEIQFDMKRFGSIENISSLLKLFSNIDDWKDGAVSNILSKMKGGKSLLYNLMNGSKDVSDKEAISSQFISIAILELDNSKDKVIKSSSDVSFTRGSFFDVIKDEAERIILSSSSSSLALNILTCLCELDSNSDRQRNLLIKVFPSVAKFANTCVNKYFRPSCRLLCSILYIISKKQEKNAPIDLSLLDWIFPALKTLAFKEKESLNNGRVYTHELMTIFELCHQISVTKNMFFPLDQNFYTSHISRKLEWNVSPLPDLVQFIMDSIMNDVVEKNNNKKDKNKGKEKEKRENCSVDGLKDFLIRSKKIDSTFNLEDYLLKSFPEYFYIQNKRVNIVKQQLTNSEDAEDASSPVKEPRDEVKAVNPYAGLDDAGIARYDAAVMLNSITGADIKLCIIALERKADDPNEAVEWILTGGSEVDDAIEQLSESSVTFTVAEPFYHSTTFTLSFEFTNPEPVSDKEWIGFYEEGAVDSKHEGRIYRVSNKVRRRGKIKWSAKLAPSCPGRYEFRYFGDEGYSKRIGSSAPIFVETKNIELSDVVDVTYALKQLISDKNTAQELVNFVQSQFDDAWNIDPNSLVITAEKLSLFPSLKDMSPIEIKRRVNVLHKISENCMNILPSVDLTLSKYEWSIAHILSMARGCIFRRIKERLFEGILRKTDSLGHGRRIYINRFLSKAAKLRAPKDGEGSIFVQTYDALTSFNVESLRLSNNVWAVKLVGEGADDAGGPYRECLDEICEELQSKVLNLLIPTPNANNHEGENQSSFIINPSATSSKSLALFRFFGRLLGIAIRTKGFLKLQLAPIFWKELIGEEITIKDLRNIDSSIVNVITNLRSDPSSFSSLEIETFVCKLSDGSEVELMPNGSKTYIDASNVLQYCDLVEKKRLEEGKSALHAIKNGISDIIPIAFLNVFTYLECERLVCGKSEIDIALLQKITVYSDNINANTPSVKYMWDVLKSMDDEEKSLFIRFTWGRSRLPLREEDFTDRFKVEQDAHTNPDSKLPQSHTCFFRINLPNYSSFEIAKEKILYAIKNTNAIDTDFSAHVDGEKGVWSQLS